MGRGESRYELILLFDRTGKEPKDLFNWLKGKDERYSYSTLKKYYQYYATAKLIVQNIISKK